MISFDRNVVYFCGNLLFVLPFNNNYNSCSFFSGSNTFCRLLRPRRKIVNNRFVISNCFQCYFDEDSRRYCETTDFVDYARARIIVVTIFDAYTIHTSTLVGNTRRILYPVSCSKWQQQNNNITIHARITKNINYFTKLWQNNIWEIDFDWK